MTKLKLTNKKPDCPGWWWAKGKWRDERVNLGMNIVSLPCIVCSAYLAVNEKSGWGWFLFVGLLISGMVNSRDQCKDNEDSN